MEQNTKPKRILTPEQLQKLANSRAKANEARKKNHEIKQFEKEKIKQEREEKYKTVMELITLQYLENFVVEAEKKDLKNQKYNQWQDCLYNSVLFENDILNNQD